MMNKTTLGQCLFEEIDQLKKENEELKQINEEHRKLNGELRNCINEAIRYINKQSKTNPNLKGLLVGYEIEKLLEILKGDSNE